MQINLELSPELAKQIDFWAKRSNETPNELAFRLLEEYVDDCQDTEEFFNQRGMDTDVLYNTNLSENYYYESYFDEQILNDLINQGLTGQELISAFKENKSKIRPAVVNMLKEAHDIAHGVDDKNYNIK